MENYLYHPKDANATILVSQVTGCYDALLLTNVSTGTALDFTDYTLSIDFAANKDAATALTCTEANGKISVASPRTAGSFSFVIAPADLAALAGTYWGVLKATDGSIVSKLMTIQLIVQEV